MPPDGMSGGGKLQAYLGGIVARVGGGRAVRVGFLEGSTETDGTSLPLVAALNEFGAPKRGQPPRPFFRTMVQQHKGEWGDKLGKVLKATDYDSTRSLGLMGELISGELRQSIADLSDPPLAASTIARKGFAKPLIHTGTMMQRVNHEVETA
jgi:hypothetical protein